MDEDLAAVVREQLEELGVDEDSIDEALAAMEDAVEPPQL
jgi:hypothetical protein